MFESIPSSLPPPWWFLAAMLVIFGLTVRRIFKLQDKNNETFRQSMDKLIEHFVEDSKQKLKAFERSLSKVLATHSDGLAGVAEQLKGLTTSIMGHTHALEGHTRKIDDVHQEVLRIKESDHNRPALG